MSSFNKDSGCKFGLKMKKVKSVYENKSFYEFWKSFVYFELFCIKKRDRKVESADKKFNVSGNSEQEWTKTTTLQDDSEDLVFLANPHIDTHSSILFNHYLIK